MIIDFNRLPIQENPGFKGGAGSFFVQTYTDGKVKLMLGMLPPGASIGMHTHEGDFEVIFLLEGNGTVCLPDGSSEPLLQGQAHYCPKGSGHSLQNKGDAPLRFYAAVAVQ